MAETTNLSCSETVSGSRNVFEVGRRSGQNDDVGFADHLVEVVEGAMRRRSNSTSLR